ncbi:hypothetical protein, partial [Micromonospora sp. LOL_015]|uniref:hypothetical protein n=1 Tax=Micromonospora sp. LOL_015 TaxID=3345416 RepID=UPI003A83E1E6
MLLDREQRRLVALIDADAPDDAAREQYEHRVRRYLRQLKSAVCDRTDRLLPLRTIRPFRVSVHNRDDLLVLGAQLTILLHVHGQRQLIQADLDEALLTELPDPPEVPDGAQLRPDAEVGASARAREQRAARRVQLAGQTALSPDALHHGLRNVVEPDNIVATSTHDRVIELVYPEFDLRPGQEVQMPGVALDLLESVNVMCEATWTVTARNQRGVLTGRFELFTVADPWALARTWPADRLPNQHDRTGSDRPTAEDDADHGVDGRVPQVCETLDDVNPLLLAAAGELPSTKLRLRLRDAIEEIGGLDDQVLDDDPKAVVERLVAKYCVPDTAYRGDPVVVGAPQQRRQEVRDFPHPTRTVTRALLDYTVSVDFDGDTDLVRASLALCHHEPQWQVHGGQIRAVCPAPGLMETSKPGRNTSDAR